MLENGRYNIGLILPFRMGVWGGEISINKFLLIPNISYKYPITRFGKWQRAARYQIVYPTLALRWFQSPLGMKLGEPDKFALISPEFHIPQMLSFYGELIGSTGSNTTGLITVYGGIGIGLGGKKLDSRTSIDLPGFIPVSLSIIMESWLRQVGNIHAGLRSAGPIPWIMICLLCPEEKDVMPLNIWGF